MRSMGSMTARKRKPRYFWTLEKAEARARAFKTRNDFRKAEPWAHEMLRRAGRLDRFGWPDFRVRLLGYWTEERVVAAARPYPTQIAFKKALPGAWQAAYRHGWQAKLVFADGTNRLGKRGGWHF